MLRGIRLPTSVSMFLHISRDLYNHYLLLCMMEMEGKEEKMGRRQQIAGQEEETNYLLCTIAVVMTDLVLGLGLQGQEDIDCFTIPKWCCCWSQLSGFCCQLFARQADRQADYKIQEAVYSVVRLPTAATCMQIRASNALLNRRLHAQATALGMLRTRDACLLLAVCRQPGGSPPVVNRAAALAVHRLVALQQVTSRQHVATHE